MKRLSILLSALLLFTLSGCGIFGSNGLQSVENAVSGVADDDPEEACKHIYIDEDALGEGESRDEVCAQALVLIAFVVAMSEPDELSLDMEDAKETSPNPFGEGTKYYEDIHFENGDYFGCVVTVKENGSWKWDIEHTIDDCEVKTK